MTRFAPQSRDKKARHRRKTRHHRLEQLEQRLLLASDWQNPSRPLDVNNDGQATPLDALRVINRLALDGEGPLGPRSNPLASYFDTNADGLVSPRDALMVINGVGQSKGAFVYELAEGEGDVAPAGFVSVMFTTLPGNETELVDIDTQFEFIAEQFNELGYFVVETATGRVGGRYPNDPGYAEKVFESANRHVVYSKFRSAPPAWKMTLPAGSHLGVYVLQPADDQGNPRNHLRVRGANSIALTADDQYHSAHQIGWEMNAPSWPPHMVGDRSFDDVLIDVTIGTPYPSNLPPELDAIVRQTVDEEQPFTYDVVASDPDPNDILTYRLLDGPTGMSISGQTGRIQWTPSEAFGPGQYSVTVHVEDLAGESDQASFTIDVHEVNKPPVLARVENQQVEEQTELKLQLTATDPDQPANTLTYSIESGPSGASLAPVTGAFAWTPTEAQGPGDYVFAVRVSDGDKFDEETFTVVVGEGNRMPILSPIDDFVVRVGEPVQFTVQASDPDIPENRLTYRLAAGAPPGATIDAETGKFSWTPTGQQSRQQYNLSVVVSDNVTPEALTDMQSFVVTVVNSAPEMDAIENQGVDELTEWKLSASATDIDLPSDSLTYSLQSSPVGMQIDSQTGELSWTPTELQGPGSYAVVVVVTDLDGATDTESFTIAAREVNVAPVAGAIQNQTIDEQAPFSLQVTASDVDRPANVLQYTLTQGPAGAQIDPATGEFSWTPGEADGPGTYPIEVTVTDSGTPTLSDQVSFEITVDEVNREPMLDFIPGQTVEEGKTLTFTATATDPDIPANNLTFSVTGNPPTSSIDPVTGVFTWTPSETEAPMNYVIQVTVSDNQNFALTDTQEVMISALEVNDPPLLQVISDARVELGETVTFTAIATDPDSPENTLTFSLDSGAPDGASIDPETGAFSWTPSANQDGGVFPITVRVTDDGDPIMDDSKAFEVSVGSCAFPNLDTWTITEYGGTNNPGSVIVDSCSAVMTEGDSLLVTLERGFVVPSSESVLQVSYADLSFDKSDEEFINDAFEIAVLDKFGNSLVQTISPGRDSIVNATESLSRLVAGSADTVDSESVTTVSIGLEAIPRGTDAYLSLRLVGNDSDELTSVRILGMELVASSQDFESPAILPSMQEASRRVKSIRPLSTTVVPSAFSPTSPDLTSSAVSVNSSTPAIDLTVQSPGTNFPAGTSVLLSGKATTPGSRDVEHSLGFELIPGAMSEGTPVDNQFFESHGVSFSLQSGESPLLGKYGAPSSGFDGFNGLADEPSDASGLGEFFLTDDGLVDGTTDPLILEFQNPISAVSGTLLDIDSDPSSFSVFESDGTPGYYNASIGSRLNGTSFLFPTSSDPTINNAPEPDLSPAADILGNWLANDPAALNGNWSFQSIPSSWPVNTETAIIYEIDGGPGGIQDLRGNFGVDNGIFVWLNGEYKFGALAPGGVDGYEYSNIDLGDLRPGKNYLQVLREDHGSVNGFAIRVTGNLVPADAWRVSAFDSVGEEVASVEVNSATAITGNGSASSFSLSDENARITSLRIGYVGNRTERIGFGLDNLRFTSRRAGRSVSHVTVNGDSVDVFDSSGNLFSLVDVGPGRNTYQVIAYDEFQNSVSASLEITGSSGTGFDLSRFSDITGSFGAVYGHTSFNDDLDQLLVNLATENAGAFQTDVPLLVGIKNISDPTVSVVGADGLMPGGTPYYDYTEAVRDGTLEAGETTESPTVTFHTPSRQQFDYELVFYGKLNEAPIIESLPKIEAAYDREYRYEVLATDPEDDPLSYTLSTKPAGMDFAPGTTDVVWQPSISDIGYHDVVVTVSDGRGGTAEQRFTIEVLEAPPNRPPVIISTPVTMATIAEEDSLEPKRLDPLLKTQVDYSRTPSDGKAIWEVRPDGSVFQTENSDPSFFLFDEKLPLNSRIEGTFQVTPVVDDDGIGFVFGFQNRDTFYTFHWSNSGFNQNPQPGMRIRKFDGSFSVNGRNFDNDLFDGPQTLYQNTLTWQGIPYKFVIEQAEEQFRIVIKDGADVIIDETIYDPDFAGGRFGFMNYSVENVLYSGHVFTSTSTPSYRYDVDAIDPDIDAIQYTLLDSPHGMQINPASGLITWAPTTESLQEAYVGSVGDDLPAVPGFQVEVYAEVTRPQRLSFTPTGELYVGDVQELDGSVRRVEVRGGDATDFGQPKQDPDTVLVDVQGRFSGVPGAVLVAGSTLTQPNLGYIDAILPDGSSISVFGPSATLGNVSSMQFDSGGRLIFVNHGTGQAYAIADRESNPVPLFSRTAFGNNLKIDSQDQIYFAESDGRVLQYDRDGTLLNDRFVEGIGHSQAISFATGGVFGEYFYAINPSTGELLRRTEAAELEVVGTGFSAAGDLAFGPDGALYVSDRFNDRILRIAPSKSTLGLAGNEHRVLVAASDGQGGVATQEFIVCVHPDPDNHDPVIISEPVTSITVPARSTGSVLYGIDFADPTSLYRVDDLNSNAVVVGSTTVSELSDLAIDPSTGEAFAINADGLYQLSLETAETAFIGATGLPAPSSLEILPDGRIIAADFESSQLYLVDRSTGAATVLFDTGWLFHGDVAFDPLSGDLFGSAFQGPPPASDTLIQIDLDRKTVSAVGDLGMVVTGLGFTSDGRLLAANSSSTNVYVVDPKTSMTRSVYDAGITLGAGLALRAVEITSDPTTHFGIEFPLGDLSFADRVVRYEPGPDVAGVGDDNPQKALGPPEPNGEFGTRTELGKDGVLVVEFVDNYLVDQQDVAGGLDLYIFEAGSAVESFQVEISENGIDWIDLGTVKGQPTGIDIGPFVDANSVFRFVRLTDVLPDETRGEADINAIGAIGSIDASVFYQYDVDAIDPDLDALSYSLLDGPDGIVIDPDNGLVTGTFSADAIGIHPVTVRVEDGRGGFDEQRFTINVRSSAGGEIRGRKTVVDVDPVVIAESSFDEGPGGWTVFLDQNQNGVRDAGERFTITDQNGDYAFTDLAEGRYTVREEARQGWEQTYPGRPVGSRLIAMSEANGDVIEVDPKTGQAVRIASIGLPADSFEFIAPYTAYLGHNSNRVSRFDLKTGTATEVAVLDGVENIEALAFDGVNLYAAISLDQDGKAERLAIIDVENSQWSEVAVFGAQFTDVDSLAVLPDGRLLFTHLSQPFSIGVYDPLTKAVTNLGGLEYSVIGLDVDRDGTIYATTYDLFTSGSQSLLLEIDLNGPIATVIGDTQIPIAAGLSVVPDYTIADGYSVHVARNHVVSDVDFTNRKLSDGPNRRPAIQSQPVTANVVGALYRYNVSATDPDKDPLTFQLPVAPAGMTIHPSLGAMVWQPSFEQVGTHEVLVQVTDGRGGSNVQSFSISVDDPNVAPVITSQPVGTAVRGATYQYELTAQDADGDPITFEIDGMMPVGMTIEPVELENSDEKIVESFHRLTWSVPSDAADADTFIRVVARDGRGGETVQQWSIDLLDAATVNRFPEITSTPRLKARHGLPWSYRVSAFDPDGEALTYALRASPQGMQITSDGLVTWTPPLDTDTSVAVDVIVSDGRGGEKRQPFRLGIVSVDTNLAPSINSVPPIAAVLDQSYAYDPSAKDPDGDSITWNLTVAPRGMSIDAVSGKIRWLPDDQQLGSHQVVLTANDVFLGHATQRFTIHVGCNNLAPAIVSVPPTVALSDRIYLYPARGEDFENDSLRWRLVNAPAGMSIDESNGVIRWTPNSGQIGSHDVLVEVRDELGFGTQSYTLVVNSADAPVDPNNPDGPTKGNRAPIITSAPVFNSEVGSLYQYQVRAIDADGDNVTIALADGSPAGMEINDGLVTWTPTESDIGTPLISILAIDQFGATSTQGYVLSVITNQPPSITSAPNTQVTRGATYRYTVAAEDPDRDTLTWSLGDSAPAGMSIDNKGRILWETTGFAIDSVDVTVTVTDNRGQPDSQDWTITINDDTQPPAVDLVVIVGDQAHRGTAQVDLGADYRVRVTATDNVAVTDIRLLVDGRPVTLDASGLVRLPTIATGDISLTAYANDAAGLEGSKSATITVVNPASNNPPKESEPGFPTRPDPDPSDAGEPVVEITKPVLGKRISNATLIEGSAYDPEGNFWYYDVRYARADRVSLANIDIDDPDWVLIKRSSSEVRAGELAVFDPAMVSNDAYAIIVTAFDSNGRGYVQPTMVYVEGSVQTGNFQLQLTDLTIPLSGIPIEVTRVYDTLEATESGDFGYGWKLGVQDARIFEATAIGSGSAFNGGNDKFVPGVTKVYLTNPDGQRIGFTYNLTDLQASWFGTTARPVFTPDEGVYDTLTIDTTSVAVGGILGALGGGINPDVYTLTTKDGTKYRYNQFTGLQTVTDRNGNVVTFTEDGISHTSGESVQFIRDHRGRITSVIDPAGERISYEYDLNGDLVEVTNQIDLKTHYEYRQTPAHYLDKAYDSLGRKVMEAVYEQDAETRLYEFKGIFDALGNRVDERDFETDQNTGVVRDGNGNATTLIYDDRGNVLQEIDPTGLATLREYGDLRNPDAETRIVDRRGFITDQEFDARGNVTKITERGSEANPFAEPIVTLFSYDNGNRVKSITNPLGHVTAFNYDRAGNLIRIKNAEDNTSSFTYDDEGRRASFTDFNGNTTVYDYTDACPCGSPSKATFADGTYQTFQYNQFGQVTEESTHEADGTLVEYRKTFYDKAGRVIEQQTGLEGDPNHPPTIVRSVYDGHLLDWEIIVNPESPNETPATPVAVRKSRITDYEYDAKDRLIRQIDAEAWWNPMTERFENRKGEARGVVEFRYDANDNRILLQDPVGNITTWVYDQLNRVVEERDPFYNENLTIDAAIALLETPSGADLAANTGAEHVRAFAYDGEGNQIEMIDRNGRRREFDYDHSGRLLEERWYNEADHTTDPLALVNELSFTYDATGNMLTAKDVNSHYVHTYDTLNRLTSVDNNPDGTLELPRVILTYGYDAQGNVTMTQDDAGVTVASEYDARNRLAIRRWYDADVPTDEAPDVDPARVDFFYNAAGREQEVHRYSDLDANTLVGWTERTYDTTGRSNDLIHRDSADKLLAGYDYDYDFSGLLTAEERSHQDAQYAQSITYTYDLTGQLTDAIFSGQDDEHYTYDTNGNRTYSKAGDDERNYTTDTANQLKSDGIYEYFYDREGNQIKRVHLTTGKTRTLQYDHHNRLICVDDWSSDPGDPTNPVVGAIVEQTVKYTFDAFGRRVGRSVDADGEAQDKSESEFFTNSRDNVWADFDEAGEAIARNLYGQTIDKMLATHNGDTNWYLDDLLGTIRQMASNSGVVSNGPTLTSFGNLVVLATSTTNRYLFTSREYDTATNLYYYRTRQYDPLVGRFGSQDPLRFGAEDSNLYRYVLNLPTTARDPMGLSPLSETLSTLAYRSLQFAATYTLAAVIGIDLILAICIVSPDAYGFINQLQQIRKIVRQPLEAVVDAIIEDFEVPSLATIFQLDCNRIHIVAQDILR